MRNSERGSGTLEMVAIAPGLLAFIVLVIFAGRLAIAHQSVEAAAATAARTATIARTESAARASARTVAASTLSNQEVRCNASNITIDSSGFDKPVGTPATITVTVRCAVNLSDLAFPGIPGSMTVEARASSPLDTYRER